MSEPEPPVRPTFRLPPLFLADVAVGLLAASLAAPPQAARASLVPPGDSTVTTTITFDSQDANPIAPTSATGKAGIVYLGQDTGTEVDKELAAGPTRPALARWEG